MQFRIGTLVSTLAVAFLIYAAATRIIWVKIESMILVTDGQTSPRPMIANERLVYIVAVNVAALWVGGVGTLLLRRRLNRGRWGFCPGCGRRSSAESTRCYRCGTRSPPGGTNEPLFPVVRPNGKRRRLGYAMA